MMKRPALIALALLAACGTDDPPSNNPPPADTTPPEITEVSVRSKRANPARAGRKDTLEITFKVSEEVAKVEVRLAGAVAACLDPQDGLWTCGYTLTGAESDGKQTVLIKATDAAGNAGQATGEFTVDLTAPALVLTKKPAPLSNSANVEVAFEADEAATFTCQLDGAEAQPCTSPKLFAGVTDGAHSIKITATDDVDNAASEAVEFTLDLVIPDTTLEASPPALSQLSDVTFAFRSNDQQARFECRLDSAPFAACTSPLALTAVAEGSHLFEVRAVDEAGNADLSPAQHAFALDRTAPVTTLAAIPDTGAPDRSITFSASESGCTFVCSIDGAPFKSCTSPLAVTGLGNGQHSIDVRATDKAGNAETGIATATFVVDQVPPSTTVLTGPGPVASTTSASFSFISSEPGSTFRCRVDTDTFAACTSPHNVTVSTDGPHTFEVAATDKYGNADPTPARYNWITDALPPTVTVDLAPPALYNQTSFDFEFSGNKANLTFTCVVDGAAPVSCASPYTVSGLAAGQHTFKVIGTDSASRSAESAVSSFTIDLDPPDLTLGTTPPAHSNQASVEFTFSTTEPNGTFECSMDGETFAACTSPHTATVTDGAHTFEVRSKDPAGNTSTPASFSFTTDLTPPPSPEIEQPDPSLVSNTTPTFVWAASTGATGYKFELSVVPDFGQLITSQTTTDLFHVPASLASARYYFRVKAVDDVGNESAPSKTGILEVRTWTFLNPQPQGATILAQSCGFSFCWFVGEAGLALRSSPNGFVQSSSGVPTNLYGLHQFDGNTLVAVGEAGTAVRTTDGGITWWPVDPGVGLTTLRAVRFAGQVGYAVGDAGTITKSSDGGLTWTKLVTSSTATMRDLAILDAAGTTVVAVGASGKTLRTTDSGATWTEISVGATGQLNTVQFVDQLTGYAAGVVNSGTSIRKTTDGGLTWGSFPHGGNTRELFDIQVQGSTIFTAGETTTTYASLRKTSDGGTTWTNVPVPSLAAMRSLQFVTDGAISGAIASGEGGMLLVSIDNGGSFIAPATVPGMGASDSTRDIRSVDFVSASQGYLVGGSGFAMKSDGAGALTALSMPSGSSSELYSVSFFDALNGWIAGGSGSDALYFTVDGNSFTRVRTPESFSLRAVNAVSASLVAVAGLNLKVARLVPGSTPPAFAMDTVVDASGATVTGTEGWRDVKLLATGGGFLVGDKGRVARLDTNQNKWVVETSPIGTSFALQSVYAIDAETAVAVGDDGKIARRTSAGWVAVTSGTTVNLKSVTFADATHGWAVGDGVILHTNDGGLTWTRQVSPTGVTLQGVSAVDADQVFVVGGSRNVLKTVRGGR